MATPALAALRAAHPEAEIVAEGRPYLAGLVRGVPSVDAFLPEQRGVAARTRRPASAALRPGRAAARLGAQRARAVPRARSGARRLRARSAAPRAAQPRARAAERRVQPAHADLDGRALPAHHARARLPRRRPPHHAGRRCSGARGGPEAPRRSRPRARRAHAGGDAGRELRLEQALAARPLRRGGRRDRAPPRARGGVAPGPGEEALAREIAGAMQEPPPCWPSRPPRSPSWSRWSTAQRSSSATTPGQRHIAVARGAPAVVVMGPTDPRHTAHLLERQRVLREDVACSPCHLKVCPIDHRCMARVGPERVAAAAAELLA